MEHEVGEVLRGRYELLAVLARGSSTIAYAALDRSNQRRVGVRHWPAELGSETQSAAELDRALAIGERFAHVHLPRALDHFAIERGRSSDRYLVHDAGEGEPLLAANGGRARSEGELRGLALALLRLLVALHNQQIVHGRVRADELLRRADGRVYLLGPAAEHDAQAGVAGDLRGLAETLLSVRHGALIAGANAGFAPATFLGLSRDFRRWLEAMLASGTSAGFASASEALQALQRAPGGNKRALIAAALAALVLMAVTVAAGFYLMKRTQALLSRSPRNELGKPIADTSFVPKTAQASAELRLQHLHSMAGHWSAIMDVAFDAAGTRIASASYDGSARLWNASDGAALSTFAHGGKVGAVAFHSSVTASGERVERVATGGGTTLRVWNAEDGQQLRSLEADGQQVTAIASTRDGKYLVSAGFAGEIRVFDADSGELVRSMRQPPKALALAIDSSGQRIASAGDDGVVRVFRFDDGTLEHELRGHAKTIDALVFSADGHTLVSSSDDRTVRVWYLPANKLMLTLQGHRDEVWALALDPAGKRIASGSKDGELRIWDAYSGALLHARKADPRGVISLAFSPDGTRLALGGGSQRVDLYALIVQKPSWRPPPITAPVKKSPPAPPPKDAAPEVVLVHRAHGLIEASEGGQGLSEAHALLEQALAQNPRLAQAYVERARVAYKRGYVRGDEYRPEALQLAREDLKRALALEPDLYEAHARVGYVELFAKNYPAAQQAGERCERIRPGDAETQLLFMNIADAQDQDEQVLLHARALIEGSPSRDQLRAAYSHLDEIYQHRGEYDAADEAYRSQINLDPDSAWSKGNYAAFLVRRERHDEAITWARAAIAQMDYRAAHMTLGEAYASKARVALETGKRDDYERWIAQAFQADPRSAEGHYVRALALRRDGDADGARRQLEAALESDPEHREAAKALGK